MKKKNNTPAPVVEECKENEQKEKQKGPSIGMAADEVNSVAPGESKSIWSSPPPEMH